MKCPDRLSASDPTSEITAAAFKLYRDYDRARATFGNTSVSTVSIDPARSSAFGSIQGSDESILHLVLLNKDSGKTLDFHVRIEGGTSYTTGRAWGFDANDPRLHERTGVTDIAGNAFEYTVPPLTAVHLVLR
jgi:mannan endo-1,4-beta-mannosidase